MEFGEAYRALVKAPWHPGVADMGLNVDGHLDALAGLAERDELPDEAVPIWYALVQHLRNQADVYERDLVRHLKYETEQPRTWAEIAELVDGHLASKQAAHAKWKRLMDRDRREAGGPGRGGWTKGRSRK